MARILVTGGAGFLGSHLCDRLLKEGHEVIALDNMNTGSADNVSHLVATNRFELVEHNIIDPYETECDYILNMACPASPPLYQRDPVYTFRTCVNGTMNLLDLAREKEAVFFQASTSEVYGDPIQHPQKEEHWGHVNPIGIRSCYDEGKRAGETLCFDYHRQYGVPIKVVRIFNTYGPRMNAADGRVVSNFINQAIRDMDITIYGDGSQTRSFCYVDDLVNGMVRLLFSDPGVTGPVNIGNPGEFTMLQLAEKVLELTGSKSEIVFKPLPSDDPKQRRPDISLAKDKLDWEPQVKLEEGLAKTIDHYRELMEANKDVQLFG
ncbi:MAG: UDP-glucuronic acid decarboxylase family protein [Pseudomonadota bacterium]